MTYTKEKERSASYFRVEALERHIVRTIYRVEAKTPEEAEALCKSGQVAYDDKDVLEGEPEDEWLTTVSVEKCEKPRPLFDD
jgi:hypothetical protein